MSPFAPRKQRNFRGAKGDNATMSKTKLAIDGGEPVRDRLLPYGRQTIDDCDVAAVTETLRSDWLTTGPKVAEFEQALAVVAGTSEAIAVSTGTAALHAALYALGVGPGDEVIVSTMTFAASANAAVFLGATPIFVDVNPDDLLIDPRQVEARVTPRTKAVVAVDYAGQPCDYDALQAIAKYHGLALVDDACHSIGGAIAAGPSVRWPRSARSAFIRSSTWLPARAAQSRPTMPSWPAA